MSHYLRNAFVREAPYVGAAISITIDGILLLAGASTIAQGIAHGITAAWVAVYVRSVSTPREAAEERVAAARKATQDETIAYLHSVKKPTRTRAATKKKAGDRGAR